VFFRETFVKDISNRAGPASTRDREVVAEGCFVCIGGNRFRLELRPHGWRPWLRWRRGVGLMVVTSEVDDVACENEHSSGSASSGLEALERERSDGE